MWAVRTSVQVLSIMICGKNWAELYLTLGYLKTLTRLGPKLQNFEITTFRKLSLVRKESSFLSKTGLSQEFTSLSGGDDEMLHVLYLSCACFPNLENSSFLLLPTYPSIRGWYYYDRLIIVWTVEYYNLYDQKCRQKFHSLSGLLLK